MRLLQQALTFDDVLLVPAYSNVLPREVSLATQLTRNIQLNIPLLSAAMDTVTEAPLAIALAQEGGLGFIHKNMTAMKQAAHVARVKRFESGVVNDPITIQSHLTVRDVLELTRMHKISGIPAVDNGKIVGIQANFWTEYIKTPDYARYMLFPRVYALSEVAWGTNTNLSSFLKRINK